MAFKSFTMYTVIVVLLPGVILAQQTENEDIIKGFQDAIQTDGNKTLEQAYNMLKEKCKKNAGDDWESNYNTIVTAQKTMMECITNYVNITEVNKKMEEAIPLGKLDEVFKDYCQNKRVPQNCFSNFTVKLRPCLSSVEQKNLKIVHNITDRLANFICHKDGDRIALFIAEDGPECFSNHTEEIRTCVEQGMSSNNISTDVFNNLGNSTDVLKNLGNSTDALKKNLGNSTRSLQEAALMNLDFDRKSCKETDKVQQCIVKVLKNCSQPTPANIAESLFKFIRQATPCSAFTETKTNSAQSVASGLALVGVGLAALLLM